MDPSEATISVFDWGVQRGDGAFEVARSYDGHLFALDAHLDRLEQTARQLNLDLPARSDMADWFTRVAADGGDGFVRLVVTRGGTLPGIDAPSRCIVGWEPMPDFPDVFRLLPVAAPWHSGGVDWDLTGAKTISYAPNMSASRRAHEAGFDDALLIARDGWVLEGPTWTIGWFRNGNLLTPALDLGILASITRDEALKTAADIGQPVVEGRFALEDLAVADEVFVMSTLKEVTSVVAVGEYGFSAGPLTARLAEAFSNRVTASL